MCDIIELETNDNLQYIFIPVSSGAIRFEVKAINDAHIALTGTPYESNPMTEIHIGGWNNTFSIVRRNRREPDKVKVPTPNVLNRNRYVGMWISWSDNYVAAGLQGEEPFIAYDDPTPHPIHYFAVRTGWGSCGSWKIQASPLIPQAITPKTLLDGKLHWVKMKSGDPLPCDALIGGFEGEPIYVARARHSGSLCPGKYVASLKKAFVPYGHHAHEKTKFEVLCGYNCLWIETRDDFIPPHAFPGGTATERHNEITFIGRAVVQSYLIPGKVHLHYKTCYLPLGTEEIEVQRYEILVEPDKLHKLVIWNDQQRLAEVN